jgi:hypothetical protein
MSRPSYNSERLALSVVEPAVVFLIEPLQSKHGADTIAVISRALTTLLLPFSADGTASSAESYIDDMGQLCVRLAPDAPPFVIWPVPHGGDAPLPASFPLIVPPPAPGAEWRAARRAALLQTTRTRLLVRSLVLQAATDLAAMAERAGPARRPKLALAIPAGTTPMDIIRTAVPLELPRRGSDWSVDLPHSGAASDASSDAPPSLFADSASVLSSPEPRSIPASPHDTRSPAEYLSPLASGAFSPLDLGDFTLVADGRAALGKAAYPPPPPVPEVDESKVPYNTWLRQHSLRWRNVTDSSKR